MTRPVLFCYTTTLLLLIVLLNNNKPTSIPPPCVCPSKTLFLSIIIIIKKWQNVDEKIVLVSGVGRPECAATGSAAAAFIFHANFLFSLADFRRRRPITWPSLEHYLARRWIGLPVDARPSKCFPSAGPCRRSVSAPWLCWPSRRPYSTPSPPPRLVSLRFKMKNGKKKLTTGKIGDSSRTGRTASTAKQDTEGSVGGMPNVFPPYFGEVWAVAIFVLDIFFHLQVKKELDRVETRMELVGERLDAIMTGNNILINDQPKPLRWGESGRRRQATRDDAQRD